jgi:adenylosuccinate synthase
MMKERAMATAVLGLQWGDEGKGKITHLLAREADMVVRFNGGPNAGHTVIDRGVKFGTHLVPAGVFHEGTANVLAGGMVIDLTVLREEAEAIAAHIGRMPDLLIAENAHLILSYHRLLEELEGSGARFGTTRRGIAPTYRDKAAKVGVRAGDLLDRSILEQRLEWKIGQLKRQWPASDEVAALDAKAVADGLLETAEPFLASIGDAASVIAAALDERRNVLFEGAQGTLLDVDHGTYPFVTSSSTTFAGLGNSIGIPAPAVGHRLGVVKAYQTRVGEGPFPTELHDETGAGFQQRGGEFGVTTGRPRRCGWLDLVALRYAVELNGVTDLALTKVDVLSGCEEIKLCRAYAVNGREVDRFPRSGDVLAACEPVYETVPGWSEPLDGLSSFGDLPAAAVAYVARIEEAVGAPVEIVSTGPEPEATIYRGL